jgi:hypothetical protein
MFSVLGLSNILEHNFSNFFRIDIIYVDHQEGHKELPGFDDELWGNFVVRYAEGFESQEWIKSIFYEDATVIDLYCVNFGWMRYMHNQDCHSNNNKYCRDDIPKDDRNGREGERDNTDCPVPVGGFFGMVVFGCLPRNERFGGHGTSIASGVEDLLKKL